ncbi:uncharacterized protein POS17_4990 [Pseudomonas sp. Os17]|nr:uncharacterized protein POS17_4990 [Pseudomonas sp. Os17]
MRGNDISSLSFTIEFISDRIISISVVVVRVAMLATATRVFASLSFFGSKMVVSYLNVENTEVIPNTAIKNARLPNTSGL